MVGRLSFPFGAKGLFSGANLLLVSGMVFLYIDFKQYCITHPKFNIAPENCGWKTSFLLGRPIFRGYVKLREGKLFEWLQSGVLLVNHHIHQSSKVHGSIVKLRRRCWITTYYFFQNASNIYIYIFLSYIYIYTLWEINMVPKKITRKGTSSSKPPFLGFRVNFPGCSQFDSPVDRRPI